MKIKKGDFVVSWCDSEMMIDIGRVATDPNEDGEYDLDFIKGGSMSPGHPDAVVVPEFVANFLAGALDLLPVDDEGIQRLPENL